MKFFVYDKEYGFDLFATEAEAKDECTDRLDHYREGAADGFWPSEIESLCWGELRGVAVEVTIPPPLEDGGSICEDYDALLTT